MKTAIGLSLMAFALLFAGCQKDPIGKNETGTFQDFRDKHNYSWVKIGEQVWLSENMAYLPAVSKSSKESKTEPVYYVYGYEDTDPEAAATTANYTTYGVLYNWPAALTACPAGWHLPTDAEWSTLTAYLGGGSTAGDKMKEKGTTHWEYPNDAATNSSGFTALPGGVRSLSYGFLSLTEMAQFWSATDSNQSGETGAWYSVLPSNSYVQPQYAYTSMGNSVRCIQN